MKQTKNGKGVIADITRALLKKTKAVSRIAKWSGRTGSVLHNFGQSMEKRGYGHNHLMGRMFLY